MQLNSKNSHKINFLSLLLLTFSRHLSLLPFPLPPQLMSFKIRNFKSNICDKGKKGQTEEAAVKGYFYQFPKYFY